MGKKLLIVLCFCCLLYPLSNGNSEEKIERIDGYKWERSSMPYKIGLCEGMFHGIQEGTKEVFILWIAEKAKGKSDPEKFLKEANIRRNKFLEEKGLKLQGITLGQITSTIDELYSDPRLKNREVIELMPLVQGRLKKGWTLKDMDEVIAYQIKVSEYSEKLISGNITWQEYDRALEGKPKVLR